MDPTPDPPRDPYGDWERAVRALAREAGVDPVALLEEWDERAAIACYLGEQDVESANAFAFDLVRARLFPQLTIVEAA